MELIGDEIKKDHKFMFSVFFACNNFDLFPKEYKKELSFCFKALHDNNENYKFIDTSVKKNRSFLYLVSIWFPTCLEHMDKNLQDDKEIVLNAVKDNRYALDSVSDRLKKDKDVLLSYVTGNIRLEIDLQHIENYPGVIVEGYKHMNIGRIGDGFIGLFLRTYDPSQNLTQKKFYKNLKKKKSYENFRSWSSKKILQSIEGEERPYIYFMRLIENPLFTNFEFFSEIMEISKF